MDTRPPRSPSVSSACFVCEPVAWKPGAFLNRYPTLEGCTPVVPKRHVEDAIGGFDEEEYPALQAVIRKVGLALRAALPVERVYVHWHAAPLPPGVPYERQQFHAVMAENGVIEQSAEARAALARRLRDIT